MWKENCPDLDIIQKGAQLHVTGRIRIHRYTGVDGIERETYDIVANRVEVITD